MAAAFLFMLVLVLLLAWLAWQVVSPPLRMAARLRQQGLRGPPYIPLVGTMPLIAQLVESTAEPFLGIWQHMRRLYGVQNFYFFGPSTNICVRDASLVREITVTLANVFEKPPIYMKILAPLVGMTSLIVAGANAHRRIRRITGAAIQFPVLQGFAPLMAELAVRFADALLPATAATGATAWHEVDVSSRLSSLTLDVICRTALATEGEGSALALSGRIGSIVTRAMTFLMDSAMNMTLFIPGWLRIPLAANVRHVSEMAELQRACDGLVRAAQQQLKAAGGSRQARGGATSLLNLLIEATDAEGEGGGAGAKKLSDQELIDQTLTFLVAGHETSSQTVMWAMYLLALHPEWQARLRGEVRGACGNDSTSPPTLEQLGNAPLLACVTNETLRLYPAVPRFDRYATADVDLKPVPQGTCRFEDEMFAGRTLSVPAGCVMTFSIGEIHRDPRYWDEPEQFNPLRFKDGISGACRHPTAYLPFAHGPRSCIGSQFALIEVRIILAVLLLRFEWKLSPNYKHKPIAEITLHARHGMPMLMRPASLTPAAT